MEKNKTRSGCVTEDPASTLPIGSQINFVSLLLPYVPEQASAWIKDWESFDGMLLAITFTDASSHRLEGSAVIVGPGIALCATHVIQSRLASLSAGTEAITCFGITSNGLQIWKVTKITVVPNSDLSILGLALASALESEGTLYKSVITTRLPKIGEQVTIFGFRSSEYIFPRSTEPGAMFKANILVCTGKIVERYPSGRDRIMLPWPALEIACPSWGGMSGGPVFDNTGKVVGLLSSSFSTDDNLGPSYASLLFPALTANFEGGWPTPLFMTSTTLLEMDPRLCSIDRRDVISQSHDPEANRSHTRYSIWE